MKSRILRLMPIALLAGLAIVGPTAPAHAVPVTFSTVGNFTGGDDPTGNSYLDVANGILITFQGVNLPPDNTVNASPVTGATFGSFDTTGTTATSLKSIAGGGFNLDIFQTSPDPGGPITFVGTLNGTLAIDASQAFVLFATPFVPQAIVGPLATVTYAIVEADRGVAGRADISPNGLSSVQGEIRASVVPEPSTMLMASLAVPALLLYRLRKGKASV